MSNTFFVKQKKERNYTVVDNTFIKDKSLSMKAKGLFTYILSLPDDWQIYKTELTEHFSDGKDAIRTAMNELVEHGYLVTKRLKDEKGRFAGYVYEVHEIPLTAEQMEKRKNGDEESVHVGFSATDNPHMDNSTAEKSPLLNTNNNKIKKELNTISSSVSDGHDREEQNLKTEKRNVKERKIVDEEAKSLAQLLLDLHREIDPKFTTRTLDKWAEDIEKIHRLDNRTYNEIRTVIYWAKRDDFWKTNIMSGRKLREKFPMLYAKMTAVPSGHQKKPLTNEIDQSKQKYYMNEDGSIPW